MSERRRLSRRQIREMATSRPDAYGLALMLILATIVTSAVAGASSVGLLVSVVFSGGTLLFVLRTSGVGGRTFRLAQVVVGLAVLGAAVALVGGAGGGATSAVGLMLALVAPLVILRNIARSPTITFRLVLGALCIYLLIGLFYSYLFPFLALLGGQPFFVQLTTPNPADYLYFSYTTLATVGYGDLTASLSLYRMVAISEALVGQLYLVSAVALLVGNIGRSIRRREDD